MEKFNIKNIVANEIHKMLFSESDVSVAGVSAAQAKLSYLVDQNLDCDRLQMDLFCAYGDLIADAPFTLTAELNLGKLVSNDPSTVEAEINKFLHAVQIGLLFHSQYTKSFLDEEYDHLETIYPDFDIMEIDSNLEKFENQPFKAIESVDDNSETGFGFINETMYFMTDTLIAKNVFQAVQKINPDAQLSAFTKNAELPIL